MHAAAPVKKGIKWNATRFLYDNVKVCKNDAADEIMIPKKALSNVPQEDSMKTLFGTTMPKGVTAGPEGTKDDSAPAEDDDDADPFQVRCLDIHLDNLVSNSCVCLFRNF